MHLNMHLNIIFIHMVYLDGCSLTYNSFGYQRQGLNGPRIDNFLGKRNVLNLNRKRNMNILNINTIIVVFIFSLKSKLLPCQNFTRKNQLSMHL